MRVEFVVSSDLRCVLGDRPALRSVLAAASRIAKGYPGIEPVISIEKVDGVVFLYKSEPDPVLFAGAMSIMDKYPLDEVDPAAIFRCAFPVPMKEIDHGE